MGKILRIGFVLILAVTIILSCTLIGTKMTDPATYSHTIDVLDQNRTTVLGLSAASAVASAAISTLPTDICTPLAEQLSEFTTWFLLILSVVFLEKYLLTIFGFAVCYILIPVGCGALLINCFFPRRFLQSLGPKLIALSAALLLVIPTSVWACEQVNEIYRASIEITVESANAVSDSLTGEMSDGENTTVIDEAKTILDSLSGSVAGVIDQFRNILNRFIEATAVMIVTNCIIPILVILVFAWIVKTLFSVPIILPANLTKPIERLHFHDGEKEPKVNTEYFLGE